MFRLGHKLILTTTESNVPNNNATFIESVTIKSFSF